MRAQKAAIRPGLRLARAAAAAAAAAVVLGTAAYGFHAATSQPVRQVIFAGELERLSQAHLEAFSRALEAAPPGVDLREVRAAARRIPWVRDAAVRRRFPDVMEIAFETHVPLARWNDAGFVSERGETFDADFTGNVPRFRGPEHAAAQMARAYPGIARALAPLDDPLAELRLSGRGGWQALLASGLLLELGRGDFQARIERFVAAWPHLAGQGYATRHADLRYPNGFAMQRAKRPADGKERAP